MALPGHRRTSSDKRRRAAHFFMTKKGLTVCPQCKKPVMPHRACGFCGVYNTRQVVAVAAPTLKKAAAHDHDHAGHDHDHDHDHEHAEPKKKPAKKAAKATKASKK